MKANKKALALVLCAVMLVAASVFGTLAYLTDTDAVTNTFTVGNVKITLDEAKVTPAGVIDGDSRVTGNEYHLIPGHTYVKDPTVHVDANSEDCYVFVKVTNNISDIEIVADDETEGTETIAEQMTQKGWTLISDGVYYYKDVVSKNQDVVVFDNFTIAGTVANAKLAENTSDTVEIIAYAIQAEGFDTATDAWNAYKTQNP